MKQYTILHTEASTGWGGQEIRILSESAGMIKRGHRVLLVCQPGSVISECAPKHGVETFTMRMAGAFDIQSICRLKALIQKQGVDIVNTHSSKDSWCAGLAAKFTGVKVIRTRHLSIPIKPSLESKLLYRTLPDAVVTTGEAVREHVIEQTGASPDAVVSIPTGVDLERFNPEKADGMRFRDDIGVEADTPLIGTVGMLRGMKGHSYLIEAAATVIHRFPEARFVIVGDIAFASNIKERLAGQISGLGIQEKVILTGYREDIPDVMSALDVFVLASVRHEGVPQVVNQALAMETPVVATDVGSTREQVLDGETGLLVEKANSDQLGEAILALLKDPDRARQMGRNGRKLVEKKFSIEAMLDATEELYGRLFI